MDDGPADSFVDESEIGDMMTRRQFTKNVANRGWRIMRSYRHDIATTAVVILPDNEVVVPVCFATKIAGRLRWLPDYRATLDKAALISAARCVDEID